MGHCSAKPEPPPVSSLGGEGLCPPRAGPNRGIWMLSDVATSVSPALKGDSNPASSELLFTAGFAGGHASSVSVVLLFSLG